MSQDVPPQPPSEPSGPTPPSEPTPPAEPYGALPAQPELYGATPPPSEPYGATPPKPEEQYGYGAPGQPYPPYGYAAGYPYGAVPPDLDPQAKSKLAAGLLGIFLGSFGIHRFYLGYTSIGLTMLLITVLTCGIGGVVTSIWGLVEGILYLTAAPGSSWSVDSTGRPLRS